MSLKVIDMHARESVHDVNIWKYKKMDATACEICCIRIWVQVKLVNKPLHAKDSL